MTPLWWALSYQVLVNGQEFPTYTTPSFTWNVTHRQDVCGRQEAFHNRSVELRDALKGFEMHPWLPLGAFSPLDPVTGQINSTRPGFSVEILDELARRAGFTWRDSFGVSNPNDLISLGMTLDQLLNWTVRTYDVSAAQWARTIARINSGTSFPEGFFDLSLIMVGEQEQTSSLDVWSFLKPFEWQVWVLIIVTFLVSGMVYLWMEWYNEDSDRQVLGNHPTENIYFASLSFIGDMKFQPSTDYARLFTLALAFWGLLISSAYTANLASFLVVRNTPSLQIQTVGDAVAARLPMCVLESTVGDTLVSKAYPGAILVRLDPAKGDKEVFLGVVRGDCTLAITSVDGWDSYKQNSEVNGDCRLTWIGRVFKFLQGGFTTFSDSGTLCTSLIRDVLNLHMVEMIEDGFVEDAFERSLAASNDVSCGASTEGSGSGETDDSSHRLSLQDMGGLFIVFYIVMAVSVVMALFVMWNTKRKQKHNMRLEGKDDSPIKTEVDKERNAMTRGDWQSNNAKSGVSAFEHTNTLRQRKTAMIEKLNSLQQELEAMRNLVLSNETRSNGSCHLCSSFKTEASA